MPTTWIVAADSTRARILELKGRGQPLQELDDLYHSEGRANENELVSDDRGRFYGRQGRPWQQGDTGDPQTSAIDHENNLFAHTVAQYLDKGRNDHRYDRLYIVAAPKFLGSLRSNFNKEVKKLVKDDLPYDISKFTEREISQFLEEKFNLR